MVRIWSAIGGIRRKEDGEGEGREEFGVVIVTVGGRGGSCLGVVVVVDVFVVHRARAGSILFVKEVNEDEEAVEDEDEGEQEGEEGKSLK